MEESQNVVIAGRNALLNQLIAFAIHRELGPTFPVVTSPELRGPPEAQEVPCVLLVDGGDPEVKAAVLRFLRECGEDGPGVAVALFNVDPRKPEVDEAVRCGVRGVFYSSVQITDMMKGMRMLMDGEICIPTEILLSLVMNRPRGEQQRTDQKELTQREMEILAHVSTGASNDEIASQLFISPHTVKTHMYNIFRKIGVSNRLHATLWATRNLSTQLPGVVSRV